MTSEDKPNTPMTPREYVETIVLPTLREFLEARDDRRRAYLACLVICHTADSLGLAEAAREPAFLTMQGRTRKRAVDAATATVQAEILRRSGDVFSVVQGIANGTKHPGRVPLLPGSERHVSQFGFNLPGAGWSEGRWGAPGLALDTGNRSRFLDDCAQQVLAAFMCAYPAHLGGIALAFMDTGLPVPGLAVPPEHLASISTWAGAKTEIAEVWLLDSRVNGPPQPKGDVVLGIVLSPPDTGEGGAPCRDWAQESWLAAKGMWLEQLRPSVGGRLKMKVLSRLGEPRSPEEVAERETAILLWTRAYMTNAKLSSLSVR